MAERKPLSSWDPTTRVNLALPACFVVPKPKPPPPPLMPGRVSAADLAPPVDPPLPFLRPWASHHAQPRWAGEVLPADVEAAQYAKFCDRHDVREAVEAVFKGNDAAFVDDVCLSMADPFRANQSSVVWAPPLLVQVNPSMDDRLGGKKLKNRHKILTGVPWSISTFADADSGEVRRNVVYGPDGTAVAQVDFGHGQHVGIHVHALVENNLEHTPGHSDDHCWPLLQVPWPWLCVPGNARWRRGDLETTPHHARAFGRPSDDDPAPQTAMPPSAAEADKACADGVSGAAPALP